MMLETGGHIAVDRVPKAVIKIIDVKCPDSGEGETFCWENLELAQAARRVQVRDCVAQRLRMEPRAL